MAPELTHPELPQHRAASRLPWISTIVICCAAALVVGFYRDRGGPGYPLDDTWIHLAFARNLAAGAGFGINPGEPTPGATSPLWIVLLSIGFLFGADPERWPWILDTGLLAACGLLGASLGRRLLCKPSESRQASAVSGCCGLVIVTSFPLVWSAAGAMEVPLFSMLLLATLWAFSRSRAGGWKHTLGWALCAGLAANARPEGILFLVILAGMELVTSLRNRLGRASVGLAMGLLLTVPYGVFCLMTSGRWFPNTYYAKTVSGAAHLPDLSYLWRVVKLAWEIAPEAILLIFPAMIAVVTVWRRDRVAAAPGAGLIYVCALPLAYACMDRSFLIADVPGNFGRYLYPLFPLAAAIGFAALLRLVALSHRRTLRFATLVLGGALVATSLGHTVSRANFYAHNVRDINRMQVQMALTLREALPPGSLVAANDVGALAFFGDFRILDLVGLVSTDVLDVMRPVEPGDRRPTESDLLKHLMHRRPAALVVFPYWYPTIVHTLRAGLQEITALHLPDNITSGGNQLVAYRIDWNRIDVSNDTEGPPYEIGQTVLPDGRWVPHIHLSYHQWSRDKLANVREGFVHRGIILVTGKTPRGECHLYVATRAEIMVPGEDAAFSSALRTPAWDAFLPELDEAQIKRFAAGGKPAQAYQLKLQTPEWEFSTIVDGARDEISVGKITGRMPLSATGD